MTASLITHNGDRNLARSVAKQLEADIRKEETRIARLHTAAATEVMTAYLTLLRNDVKGSGIRNAVKLSGTWRGRVFPGGGKGSMSPAIWLFNRAPAIVDGQSLGIPIRATTGRFLAVPVGRALDVVRSIALASNRSRDGAGRFQSEGRRVDQVARALGVQLIPKPMDGGKGFVLTTRQGEVLFILTKQVKAPRRMQGRALLASFSGRFAKEFAAALDRAV